MHPDWVEGLLHQCEEFNVPFHFKQWGNWVPTELANEDVRPRLIELRNERPVNMTRLGKGLAGRTLDGTTWDGLPHTRPLHA